MYRIVKRIVHTITTVTLVIRWEDAARQETVEEQIVLPSSHSITEEEVGDSTLPPDQADRAPEQDR